MNSQQFGYHLTLDLYECPKEPLERFDTVYNVLSDMVYLLKMTPLAPPFVIKAVSNENSGGKDPGGITGFVIIAESHISIHTFAKRGFISMDVYSCKEFNYDDAENFVRKVFQPTYIEKHKIDRGLHYPTQNIYE